MMQGRILAVFLLIVVIQVFLAGGKAGAIIGSEPANPKDWTSILLFGSNGRYCSAVAIGPRVMVTAAHCVQAHSQTGLALAGVGDGWAKYQITCDPHPKYPDDASIDYALCKTDLPIAVEQLERVEQRNGRSLPGGGGTLVLTGYGCQDSITREFDGKLSVGRASIQMLPSKDSGFIFTNGSAGCLGDGGGGVFAIQEGSRILEGIISKTDNQSFTAVSPIGVDRFWGWAEDWANKNSVLICGIAADQVAACTARALDVIKVPQSELRGIKFDFTLANLASANLMVEKNQTASGPLPLRTIAYRKGEIPRNVIALSCPGWVGENFVDRSVQYLIRKGVTIEKDQAFLVDGVLNVPVCPGPSEGAYEKEMTIGPNDNHEIHFYYDILEGNQTFKELWAYDRPPNNKRGPFGRDSHFFLEAFRALNPAQDPHALTPGKIVLPLRPHSGGTFASVSSDSGAFYTPIPDIPALNPQAGCAKPQYDLTYPFDLVAVLTILSNEEYRRNRDSGLPAKIVIVDSGLIDAGIEASPFPARMLSVNALVQKDEIYNRMVPRFDNPDTAAHGTWVATASLGGALFAHIMDAMPANTIKLRPDRYYDLIDGRVVVLERTFNDFFNQLSQEPGRFIVNISLKSSDQMPGVRQKLEERNSNMLFVAAAGNGLGDGTDNTGQVLTEDSKSFPAAYGGHNNVGRSNLISVAAVYLDGGKAWNLAPFSNRGPTVVEIGAPGCVIPVFSYDAYLRSWGSEPVLKSGTSFSAPLVSFTAAMISAEVPELTSSELKQRILSAADLNPGLSTSIADGRVLNVVKSLAVMHDVIETDNGIAIGEVRFRKAGTNVTYDWTQELPISCISLTSATKQNSVNMMKLLKIVPHYNIDRERAVGKTFDAQSYPDRLYVSGGDGQQPEPLECKLTEDVAVDFSRLGSDLTPVYSWESLRDVVLRVPRAREANQNR